MLPAEFENRMRKLLGNDYAAFSDAVHGDFESALRVNPCKADIHISPLNPAAAVVPHDPGQTCELPDPGITVETSETSRYGSAIRSLFPEASLQCVPWCREGFYFTPSEIFRPGRSPYHAAGAYYIQEPSAMAAAVCLNAQPGECVLDLCAAPGGKSTQIAASMRNEGLLIANEIIPSRAKILSENIERMGIRNTIVTNESPQHLCDLLPAFFDRILVDAPCSGEGMFRKNPEAVSEWSRDAVTRCAARQDEILSCAASLLTPGGTMVYSTCTFSPEENEGTLTRFLKARPDFHVVQTPFTPSQMAAYGFSQGQPQWYPDAPDEIRSAVRIFPHRTKGEGHFIAVLKKNGKKNNRAGKRPAGSHRTGGKSGKNARASVPSVAFLKDALSEILKDPASDAAAKGGAWKGAETITASADPGRISTFGDQIYLLPAATPSLSGMKVLRPGLHLGTMKKNRFEPSHALALALSPADAVRSYDLLPAQGEAWIGGQTIPVPPQTPSGWTLMTVNGYSLGWGKCVNNIMKNHYPKGLRR